MSDTTPAAIAVDIEGELAMLEQALVTAERAMVMAAWLEESRVDAEELEHEQHEHWLGHSSRDQKLRHAVMSLRNGVELLGRAMRAPTTIDDEIPEL